MLVMDLVLSVVVSVGANVQNTFFLMVLVHNTALYSLSRNPWFYT